jgi:bla regulator protein BlaR1
MEMYILKSALCLAIFFVFYKALLENTSLHSFKRFYLLLAILVSFIIPFITITTYQEIGTAAALTDLSVVDSAVTIETQFNYIGMTLWIIYGLGVLFFGIKFLRNLGSMINKIRRNPKQRSRSIFYVLLNEQIVPHTFFSYIFFNKQSFKTGAIPQEVIAHERTHAREKHSLDVLLMEICHIVFWFNPLFYFFKKAIKLNHEFLADRSVLKTGTDTTLYQKTLLAYSSNACSPQLAHSINYSLFKKRFTVMKTNTSRSAASLRTFLLIPLVLMLLYSFTDRQTIYTQPDAITTSDSVESHAQKILLMVTGKEVSLNSNKVAVNEFASYLDKFTASWTDKEIKNFKWDIFLDKADNGVLNALHKEYLKTRLAKTNSNSHWIPANRLNSAQTSATREEMKEYTRLAKKYNAMTDGNLNIKQKELKRMEYIYHKMSPKQKANAEPFPVNLPPPPPPAPEIADVPNPDAAPKAVEAPKPVKVKAGVNDNDPNLPPPPPPPSEPEPVLDHIIRMAKKGATFYYEGEKISSDKAISLIKANDQLNVHSSSSNTGKPVVKITTKPIKLN